MLHVYVHVHVSIKTKNYPMRFYHVFACCKMYIIYMYIIYMYIIYMYVHFCTIYYLADVDQAGANATGETTEPNDQPVTSNGGGGGGGGGIEPNEGEPENTPTGPPPTQLIKDEVTKSTQEIGQTVTRKRHISPFVQTAAYLLDVHAAKVRNYHTCCCCYYYQGFPQSILNQLNSMSFIN